MPAATADHGICPTMPDRAYALTPDALRLMDTIARTGSFAAAARELGRVPSALTYSVRQLEESLDVLLFDRSSRQARFTPAGEALLQEARRLLADMGAVAQRVQRVASGWEPRLCVAHDDIVSSATLMELADVFYTQGMRPGDAVHGTQLRLRTEVLAGTWEALLSGAADLAIGVGTALPPPAGVVCEPLGTVEFYFVVSPCHALATQGEAVSDADLLRHRAVAVADSAQRLDRVTVNLLPGQDVFTVSSMAEKIDAIARNLGCGYVPEPMVRAHLAQGTLRRCHLQRPPYLAKLGYAWRAPSSGGRAAMGLGLQWWLKQLDSAATRTALIERHGA